MKKALWASAVLAIIGFVTWSSDPLNDVANFIIAGSIPGTDTSIGLWSTLLLAAVLLLLVRLGFKHASLQMLEHTATQIKAEEAQAEFKSAHEGEFDRSKRSVIAAPSSEAPL